MSFNPGLVGMPEYGGLADRFKEIERRLVALERGNNIAPFIDARVASGLVQIPTTEGVLASVTFSVPEWVNTLTVAAVGAFSYWETDEAPASYFFRTWAGKIRIDGVDGPASEGRHGSDTNDSTASEIIFVATPAIFTRTITNPSSSIVVQLRGSASSTNDGGQQSLMALAIGSS